MVEELPGAINWRCLPMGEAALLVAGEGEMDLVNRYALALAHALETNTLNGVGLVAPAVQSVLVQFDPFVTSHERIEEQIRNVLEQIEPAPETPARVVSIPVRYGGADGPDLDETAARLGLTPRDLIAEHCGRVYRVLMVGFTLGFPFIGPLPERLKLPRRATPRLDVPAGSVAIAVGMTGIYPARLPGGWHLIGRTDLTLFDSAAFPPTLLAPGDGVRFAPLPGELLP
jgi:inhibitor of KinA